MIERNEGMIKMLKMTVKVTAADIAFWADEVGVQVEDFDIKMHFDFILGELPGNVIIVPLAAGECEITVVVTNARDIAEVVYRFAQNDQLAEELLCTAISRV